MRIAVLYGMINIVEKHIFFLDDEPTIREVVRETLKDSNFKVRIANERIAKGTGHTLFFCFSVILDLTYPKHYE